MNRVPARPVQKETPMPELPDVEVFKRYVDATALHKAIDSLHFPAPEMLESISRQALVGRLHGRRFTGTRRHGKYLFVHSDGAWTLVLHFGMSGYLHYARTPGAPPDHTRLVVGFANGGRLAYVCMRKLGRIALTDDPHDYIQEKGLGPDPLADDFSRQRFVERLGGRRGSLKSALMNQSIMAGIGNVYADEILFQTGRHPETPVAELADDDLGDLFDTMQAVIENAVAVQARPGDLPDDYLTGRRDAGRQCPRCGGRIRRQTVAGRSAYYCDRHQKR